MFYPSAFSFSSDWTTDGNMYLLLRLVNFFLALLFSYWNEPKYSAYNVCSPFHSLQQYYYIAIASPCSVLRAQAQSQSQSQSQMLLGSLPGSCSDLSQFVSLSASRVGDEEGVGEAWQRPGAGMGGCCCSLAVGLPLLLLLIYFDLFTIAIYISSFFLTPCLAPLLLSLLSPHFVSHFSCSFNLENSEKRAQSNKIKLGFIDPFQFDSLTPPLLCFL